MELECSKEAADAVSEEEEEEVEEEEEERGGEATRRPSRSPPPHFPRATARAERVSCCEQVRDLLFAKTDRQTDRQLTLTTTTTTTTKTRVKLRDAQTGPPQRSARPSTTAFAASSRPAFGACSPTDAGGRSTRAGRATARQTRSIRSTTWRRTTARGLTRTGARVRDREWDLHGSADKAEEEALRGSAGSEQPRDGQGLALVKRGLGVGTVAQRVWISLFAAAACLSVLTRMTVESRGAGDGRPRVKPALRR